MLYISEHVKTVIVSYREKDMLVQCQVTRTAIKENLRHCVLVSCVLTPFIAVRERKKDKEACVAV